MIETQSKCRSAHRMLGVLALAIAAVCCALYPVPAAGAETATDQLIIVYEDELCEPDASVIATQEELLAASNDSGAIAVATVAAGTSVEEALDALADDPNVAAAQPNYTYQLLESDDGEDDGSDADSDADADADSDADSDDSSGSDAGSDADSDADSDAGDTGSDPDDSSSATSLASYLELAGFTAAWEALAGADDVATVTVAVVDTGCNLEHADLANIVDASLAYDVVSSTLLADAGVANNGDSNGHGTMVCGVVAAAGGGLVRVLPIRIFGDDDTATTADILAAYAYLEELIEAGELSDLRVINLSIGYYASSSTAENDELLEAAIEAMLEEHGVLTVCAGGNQGTSRTLYPADLAACLAVISVDATGSLSSFSDYGDAKDLCAFGEDVCSTAADGGSTQMSGTSMAAPQVAAAAALVWAANPELSAAEVVEILLATAAEAADVETGVLDAGAAVAAALAAAEADTDEVDEDAAADEDDVLDDGDVTADDDATADDAEVDASAADDGNTAADNADESDNTAADSSADSASGAEEETEASEQATAVSLLSSTATLPASGDSFAIGSILIFASGGIACVAAALRRRRR